MFELLQTAVYSITVLLIWPATLLLIFGVGRSAFLLGETMVERYERRHPPSAIKSLEDAPATMTVRYGIQEWKAQRAADPSADDWLVLDRTEAALARRIDRARMWVRLGPALGLIGTLLPLGPALESLARNDLGSLSRHLIVAFGATVLGILAGALSWVVMNLTERWYRLDLAELRHALEERAA
jgi:biopolymer transport protein ExbB/TolQ